MYKISLDIKKTIIMKEEITAKDMIKRLGLNKKPKLNLYGVVKRLRLKYLMWKKMNEIRQLDMDIMCDSMTPKEYDIEYKLLSKQYDNLK